MNEYEITFKKGFETKKFYTKAESAEHLQKEVESKFAYEITEEGLILKEIKLLT